MTIARGSMGPAGGVAAGRADAPAGWAAIAPAGGEAPAGVVWAGVPEADPVDPVGDAELEVGTRDGRGGLIGIRGRAWRLIGAITGD
ncbi:MAG: hypothetical protein QOE27_2101, partial [Solirubrobacteraceae bacterium]|nr:hypothetical protein [Solirubrobacteraceae bacterium]